MGKNSIVPEIFVMLIVGVLLCVCMDYRIRQVIQTVPVNQEPAVTMPVDSSVSVTDTSYMWLDTTKAEYRITEYPTTEYRRVTQDTFAIYSYHTNGMSAVLRIHHFLHPNYGTRIIYQDSKGIPRAIKQHQGRWLCIDKAHMDYMIHQFTHDITYYQAIFYATNYDQFHIATNPIACETD